MDTKQLFALYDEGAEFVDRTKQVDIQVRGQTHTFTIKPMDYAVFMAYAAVVKSDSISIDDKGDITFAVPPGQVEIDILLEHVLEFAELSVADLERNGIRDRRDFVETALGWDGVAQLFGQIFKFSQYEQKEANATVEEIADTAKN